MGAAMALRLRERGLGISVWNRSPARAESVAAEQATGGCIVGETAVAAVSACSPGSPVLLVITDTAGVLALLRADGFAEALQGKTLVNLVSGNADDARQVAASVDDICGDAVRFVDGAYCGNSSKVRAGVGQLFLSSCEPFIVDEVRPLLEELGSVSFCGPLGASRALDYGVVDLFFVNLLSFMSNAAALEREGADMKLFFAEAGKRLSTVPAALEMYHERMKSRDEAAYDENVTASLATARSFWASRLPYSERCGDPTQLTDLFVQLLDEASGGMDGPHAQADVSRLQEVVRYGPERAKRPLK